LECFTNQHADVLLFVSCLPRLLSRTIVEEGLVRSCLPLGDFIDALVDSALANKLVHRYGLLLANAVTAVFGLLVHGGVEITVVDDTGVSRREVDPHPPSSGGEKEDGVGGVVVKGVDDLHALIYPEVAVQAVELHPQAFQETLQYVQVHLPLGEEENPVALGDEVGEEGAKTGALGRSEEIALDEGELVEVLSKDGLLLHHLNACRVDGKVGHFSELVSNQVIREGVVTSEETGVPQPASEGRY